MKKIIFITAICSLILLFSCKDDTVKPVEEFKWHLLEYQFDATINDLLVTKSNFILLATSGKGILLSKDKWKTFSSAEGLNDTIFYSLKQLTDGRIAAISRYRNVYISFDEGLSWINQNVTYPDSSSGLQISGNGYVACKGKLEIDSSYKYYSEYYFSKDFGKTWESFPTKIDLYSKLSIDGNDKYLMFIYTNENNYSSKIYIRKNDETSFTETYNVKTILNLGPNIRLVDDLLFVNLNGLSRSKDGGISWEKADKGIYWQNQGANLNRFSYTYDRSLFALENDNGIYLSSDKGINWKYFIQKDYGSSNYFLTNDKYLIKNYFGTWFISNKRVI